MKQTIKQRLIEYINYKRIGQGRFEKSVGFSNGYINNIKGTFGADKLEKIFGAYPDLDREWLITGKGDMLKEDLSKPQEESNLIKSDLKKETRPRIPLNAAAGSVSVALDSITCEDCENIPVIESFTKYNYTILVKGDSMEPEFHSGDELACLFINGKSSFVQWGNFHVLDTSQGIIVKRIYDDDEYILCVSENKQLFKDFRIHKSEIYSISLVIGMLRRF